MTGCPVLCELEATEAYDPEYEQVPVLSGGDYDIAAIRDCGEKCLYGAMNVQLGSERNAFRARVSELEAENARLTAALQAFDKQVGQLKELLHEAVECIRDNPEASSYAMAVVRDARAALEA